MRRTAAQRATASEQCGCIQGDPVVVVKYERRGMVEGTTRGAGKDWSSTCPTTKTMPSRRQVWARGTRRATKSHAPTPVMATHTRQVSVRRRIGSWRQAKKRSTSRESIEVAVKGLAGLRRSDGLMLCCHSRVCAAARPRKVAAHTWLLAADRDAQSSLAIGHSPTARRCGRPVARPRQAAAATGRRPTAGARLATETSPAWRAWSPHRGARQARPGGRRIPAPDQGALPINSSPD